MTGAALHSGSPGDRRRHPGAFLHGDGLLQRCRLKRQRADVRGRPTRRGYRREYDDRHIDPIRDRPGPRLRR